jgi:DNA topoisomerase-3
VPDEVKTPLLTAEWEHKLKQIERGELSPDAFMDGIYTMTRDMIRDNAGKPVQAGMFAAPQGDAIGVCPRCGNDVRESAKGFFCNSRECGFALWKDNRFFTSQKKKLTKTIARALLKTGRASVAGLYSKKTGKKYDAVVVMEDTGGKYINFKLEFTNSR